MTYHNEPIEKFLEDARWRLFNSGHYRHADKMDEVLTALSGESDELQEAQGEIERLKEKLSAAQAQIEILEGQIDDVMRDER